MRGQIVGTGAQQTWRRLTSAPVGNTPIGTIHAIYTNVCPTGYLPCDGSAYDTTQFPDLYALLTTAGVTNPDHTPDFRECALVGVGNNSTDTLGTHDIYTLGQFKDCQAHGTLSLKSAGYTVTGNNVILNTTVNAANRKLVTQYISDASATDLQTITVGSASTTRTRSKGVYWIIKATVGNEISDINQLADDLRDEMALCMQLKPVNVLPTGADITTDMYYCNGTYYVGQVDASDPTQSICVPLETGAGSSIFVGTQAEWDALSTAEKNEYSQASLTDVNSVVHVPTDTIENGNLQPVTSNAVYDALAKINGSTSVVWGNSRTVNVETGATDWWSLIPPAVPSGKYILWYFAYVSSPAANNVRASLAYGSGTDGKPDSVITRADVDVSGVEIKIGAVVRDK